jgi:aspartate aminotransferase-like enzyme
MVSFLEPGDRVVIGECGRFGLLMIEIAERWARACASDRHIEPADP